MNASLNKWIVIPTMVSLLALTLVGCEEEDVFFGVGSSNNITLSRFADSYDSKANATAIARIEETYRTGNYEIKTRNLVNNYSNQSLNTLDRTVLADKFEGRLENKDIEVNGRTVKRPIYEKNSNNKFNYQTTYKTLDLSGVKADSYNAGVTLSDSRGIMTALNHYAKLPTNLAFPAGSVCYIPVVSSERSFLAFNEKDKTGYSSLDKWVEAAEARFKDDRDYSTSRFGVGINNKQKAAQVMFFEYKEQPAYQYNGVEYSKDIYEADYVAKGSSNPNTNSFRGLVDCTIVNDVAADFLEDKIKRYY
ncbi:MULTISPECIES: hypothetical protein [unclassified Psychrobacter]|uniref:hypothetical protein n=1 Tax=unclassified Psychrobacter TaxID=196806 RepID=UPI0025E9EE45|nr:MULTISPECIES: hypothetical protein [unclassified Psychrobacter]